MPSHKTTEAEIIQKTLETIRSFYNRNKEVLTASMSDHFMWIGSNDFQWCEGLAEFCRIIKNEMNEPSVMLSDEEFHVLFHERNVWVLYGRYKATAVLEDGSILHAHVRGTYIWHMEDGELKLVHIHGSHAQDVPLNQLTPEPVPFTENSSFFDYMKQMNTTQINNDKLAFRDNEKNYHYLFPTEILYLKAAGQYSIVYTKTDSFQVWGLLAKYEKALPESFQRIHKSYLVNTIYVDSIHRYEVTLQDGNRLPVGKERYMELKRFLQQ